MKKNVYLFQPQDPICHGDEKNYWMPYSAATVWSYVNQFEDISSSFTLKEIIFRRDRHDDVLRRMENPVVVGFSCYVWNERYSLALAEKIKSRWPTCQIIFGGEQVSGRYLKHDFIDSLIIAEGELAFLEVLRKVNAEEKIPPILKCPRLDDLDIPSPYLNGVLDQLVQNNPGIIWATTIESNRGCPYACTFCDWGAATQSKVKKFNLEKIEKELEWIKNQKIAYLFFADANFGIFKQRDIEIAKLIRKYAEKSMIEAVNLQYAKNNTTTVFEIGKILGPYNRGITVSMQSMNHDTLKAIKRKNLEVNDISLVMKMSEEYEVHNYTEMILGLPCETKESWKSGLCKLLDLGQHQSIDFNLAEILENSELNSFEYKQKYGIKTQELDQYYTLKVDDYPEKATVICETNTMSKKEMVECYMYAWMIVHFHINGYTQLYAKYLRNIFNIGYREFYDAMFESIDNCNIFKLHFKELYDNLDSYLDTGKLKRKDQRGDALHFASYEFCYNNRNHLFELGKLVVEKFDVDAEEIRNLQKLFIYELDHKKEMPIRYSSNINIETWTRDRTSYIITNKLYEMQRKISQNHNDVSRGVVNRYQKPNFWFMRRKNLLKNQFLFDA